MLIEYVASGALVVAALVATFVGLRRRRADRLTADPAATFPYIGAARWVSKARITRGIPALEAASAAAGDRLAARATEVAAQAEAVASMVEVARAIDRSSPPALEVVHCESFSRSAAPAAGARISTR